MTNNDELALKAESIIADMNLKHGQNDFYAPVMTWGEFSILRAERDADKKRIAELNREVDAANARVDTKCAQLCKQDEEIEMLRLRIAELEARTVTHDVGVMNIGNPYCEDHLVACTVTGGQLAEGIYYLDARRVGDI